MQCTLWPLECAVWQDPAPVLAWTMSQYSLSKANYQKWLNWIQVNAIPCKIQKGQLVNWRRFFLRPYLTSWIILQSYTKAASSLNKGLSILKRFLWAEAQNRWEVLGLGAKWSWHRLNFFFLQTQLVEFSLSRTFVTEGSRGLEAVNQRLSDLHRRKKKWSLSATRQIRERFQHNEAILHHLTARAFAARGRRKQR